MPKLSANNLDLIPNIPLTLDLIHEHYHRPMTDDEARERLETVQHECAHLVAAIACRSSILSVELHAPKESKRKPSGRVDAAAVLLQQEAFVSLVGCAWESEFGDVTRAQGDLDSGIEFARQLGRPHEPLLAAASRFVCLDAAQPICNAAVGIICMMPTSGILFGGRSTKLGALVDWLKPQTPVFRD